MGNCIEGSNPSFSAIIVAKALIFQGFFVSGGYVPTFSPTLGLKNIFQKVIPSRSIPAKKNHRLSSLPLPGRSPVSSHST
jgi:hypothetical protein